MTRRIFPLITAIVALSLTVALASGPAPTADTIIAHGKVYTGNSEQPWADAIAIHDGKIIAVGDEGTLIKLRSDATQVIEASGHLVLPGFVDCHVHVISGSPGLGRRHVARAKYACYIPPRVRHSG